MNLIKSRLLCIPCFFAGFLLPGDIQAMQWSGSGVEPAPAKSVVIQIRDGDQTIEQLQADYRTLDKQCVELAREIQSNQGDKSVNQQKLAVLVQRTFNARQQLLFAQLSASARRLEKIQAAIATRQAAQTQIVQRRVEELLKDTSPQALERSTDAALADAMEPGDRPARDLSTTGDSPAPTELKIYEIEGTDPELAFRILSQRLAGKPEVRMELDKPNKLVLQARPGIHSEVRQLLNILAGVDVEFVLMPLKNVDVRVAIAAIKTFFGVNENGEADPTKPIIDGDMLTQRLFVVKASQKQFEQIKVLVEKMEAGAGTAVSAGVTPATPAKSETASPDANASRMLNALDLTLPATNAGASTSDLLLTSPAEMRKLLYEKSIAFNSAKSGIEAVLAAIQKEGETDFLKKEQQQHQQSLTRKEAELRFALLQYEQIIDHLRFVISDIHRKIAAAKEDFSVKELLFQRGSMNRAELNAASRQTRELDVDLHRAESLLKLYEAAGDLLELAQAKQRLDTKQPDPKN